jgi:hypothetical protein
MEAEMRKVFEIGGFVAAAILIAFGITAIVMGFNGRHTVNASLQNEYIVGSPDMTPTAIKAEAQKAGVTKFVTLWPSKSVAGLKIDTGTRARSFAEYMRIHTLEATSGLTYAQMGRYQALSTAPKSSTDGAGGTSDPKYAVIDPKTKQPVDNGRRNIWVTETALTTALNTSYMADQLGLFGIVTGFALLLSGIGFAVLAVGGTLRNAEPALKLFGARTPKAAGTAIPTA